MTRVGGRECARVELYYSQAGIQVEIQRTGGFCLCRRPLTKVTSGNAGFDFSNSR